MSTAPITVFWDHTVVPPAEGTDETTLVLCKTEDGDRVTLSLEAGQRRALAMKLIDPDDASGHIARLAFLREQIRKLKPGERLTAKSAARLCRKRGYPAVSFESTVRRDLAALHREGLLDMHEESFTRWYTAPADTQQGADR